MRDYGKVYGTYWTSETTRDLSDQGRLLALYLLSGPHANMIGCYRLPDGYVMEDMRWDARTVSKGFGELFRKGFATPHEATKWVFIHNFLKWNPLENPNQGKAAVRLFQQVPNDFSCKCELAKLLYDADQKIPHAILKPFLNGSGTVSKPGTGTGTGTGSSLQAAAGPLPAELDPSLVPEQPKPKNPRPRNALFDAVAEVTGSDPDVVGKYVGKIASLLTKAQPPYTADDVREFARRFWEFCPYASNDNRERPTLGELEKNIGQLRAPKPPPQKPQPKRGSPASRDDYVLNQLQGLGEAS